MAQMSEYAPFIEEYQRSIETLLGWVKTLDKIAARSTDEDRRGGAYYYSYELQWLVADLEDQIQEMRLTGA